MFVKLTHTFWAVGKKWFCYSVGKILFLPIPKGIKDNLVAKMTNLRGLPVRVVMASSWESEGPGFKPWRAHPGNLRSGVAKNYK